MLFTKSLITRFIPDFKNVPFNKFNDAINSLGMEIEGVYTFNKIENVVIGELLEANKVEGTHLSLCKVKIDSNTTNQIVCGASNLIVGKKVIVALEGARLPNGVIIAKREIHGMESNGMMCAYSELTNNKAVVADAEQDEIIMLDEGVVGSDQWMHLIGLDETIYDITVPANRNDENSYLVFCYELANKLDIKFEFNLKEFEKTIPSSEDGKVSADSKFCSALMFLDYDLNSDLIQRSNWATKAILMNHGIKPFNKLMDKLALITLLTNCPTNVYDADKLVGALRCKLGQAGLKFVGLNGKTYDLTKNDIVIYDQNQAVSLACVLGAESTKLTSRTSKVKIEVGNFNYANVRNTSIRLNIDTDASKRASRPLSNYLNLVALALIKKEFGQPTAQVGYFKPNWIERSIPLSYRTLSWFINEDIKKDFVASSLRKLGYATDWLLKTKFRPPYWRLDVRNQEDMYEDILKIIDINLLKPIAIEDKLLPIASNKEYELKSQIKDLLINNYFSEVKTYNLTHKKNLNKFNLFNVQNALQIQCNNSNREFFRTNLIDNMLKVYQYNDARKLDLIPIFEIQKLFSNSFNCLNLTCLCLGKYDVDGITKSTIFTNANYLKALVKEIAKILNVEVEFKIQQVEQFYDNESIGLFFNEKLIGYIGKIKKSQLKPYDLNNKDIYCLSINLDELLVAYKPLVKKVKGFGEYQRLSKDINIILDKQNAYMINQKINDIKSIEDIQDAKLINVFEKDNQIVYTVRYYLVDSKQFTTEDLEAVSKQVENLNNFKI